MLCEGCKDIFKKKECEGGGYEDKVFYCEGIKCVSICVWKVFGVVGFRIGWNDWRVDGE